MTGYYDRAAQQCRFGIFNVRTTTTTKGVRAVRHSKGVHGVERPADTEAYNMEKGTEIPGGGGGGGYT